MLREEFKLTQRGLYWLKINMANTYGYEKYTFEEKINWFDDKSYEDFVTLIDTAENKHQYILVVEDYYNYLRDEAVQNIMYLDCSNQALQIYGLLTGDLETTRIACLGSGNVRNDAYNLLAIRLDELLKTLIFNRKNCKKSMMTTLYGKRKAYYKILEEMKIQESKLIELIEGYELDDLGNAFESAMNELVPAVMQTMALLQDLNNEDIDTYYWTMKDGFKVKYDVKQEIEIDYSKKSKGGTNINFSAKTEMYGGHQLNAGMAPNVIHSVDGYILRRLREMLKGIFFTGVHDAYAVHYNDIDRLVKAYKIVLCDILRDKDFLPNIMSQISGGNYVAPEYVGTLTEEHIMNSEYALA